MIPSQDLIHTLEKGRETWNGLRGARVFITGGTGFFGKWLVSTFLHANQELKLGAQLTLLSRDPARAMAAYPAFQESPALKFIRGDVRHFPFPKEKFSHVIHGGTEANAAMIRDNPQEMEDTILAGTRHVLEFAQIAGARKFQFVSSGAVYGKAPGSPDQISEDHPSPPSPVYGAAKKKAEQLCLSATAMDVTLARCFAFVGPHLPLDAHYAIGNFIGDALKGGPIQISGDGTAVRSYLYAADLAVWLWTILTQGRSGQAYNVGSDHGYSLADVAHAVARQSGTQVQIAKAPTPGAAIDRYVPSVRKAGELKLQCWIGLEDSIRRTLEFKTLTP